MEISDLHSRLMVVVHNSLYIVEVHPHQDDMIAVVHHIAIAEVPRIVAARRVRDRVHEAVIAAVRRIREVAARTLRIRVEVIRVVDSFNA